MAKPKILIPMLEAGAGHLMPARAVRDAIEARYPGEFQIDVVDFPKECGAYKDDYRLKHTWDRALKHPFIARTTFRALQAIHPVSRFYLPLTYPTFLTMATGYVAGYKPDVIFTTHFFCLSASARARDELAGDFKVIGFVTDPFMAYTFWAEPRADLTMVASEQAQNDLVRMGVPRERTEVRPFPINERFFDLPRTKDELQREIGIDSSMPTMLATAGGQGIGKLTGYVEKLYKQGAKLNIIFVCGRNEEVKKRFDALSQTPSATNLLVFGFVNNMHELLYVADFSAIKAGASATLEALMMNTPPIITDWAVAAEKPNLDYTVENDFGWWAGSEREFMTVIHDILTTDVLDRYRRNLAEAGLRTGAGEIAEYVVAEARRHAAGGRR
ncbi:MAG: MGDG synthase family glycosyltransferase [Spirochaetota bacterium]